MNDSPATAPKKRSTRFKILVAIAAFLPLLAVIGGWIYYRNTYPYGYSHACSKGLGMALRLYAYDHKGWLPYGNSSPEASLGIIAKNDDAYGGIWVLGGKTIPREKVKAALTQENHFNADSCGWHYIEGLREDDSPQIAVAWDKVVGMDHHGGRRAGIMHEVVFLDGSMSFISKSEWPNFVSKQKKLLDQVIAGRESNAPRIRWSDEATLGTNRFPAPLK